MFSFSKLRALRVRLCWCSKAALYIREPQVTSPDVCLNVALRLSSRNLVERNLVSRIAQVAKQLQVERDRMQKEVERLTAAIDALNAASRGDHFSRAIGPRRRRMSRRSFSAAARARMAAAQRARWAKARKHSVLRRPKRVMSQSERNRIAAAQRARWAKLKQKRKQSRAKPQQKKSP